MIVSGVNFPMIYDNSVTATFRAPTDMSDNTRRCGSDRKSAGNIKAAVLSLPASNRVPAHPILAVGVDRKAVRPRLLKPHDYASG
jgi:hypothetical protein